MSKLKLNKTEVIFILLIAVSFITLAIVIPYNNAPDEEARYLIPQYIYKHMQLPLGTDAAVRIPMWGISYAFSPMLSYIVSSVFMKIASFFITSFGILLFSARLASVIFSTFTVYFTIQIAKVLFRDKMKWIFICLVSTLPCFTFISSYVNTDALALLSTAIIIYSWLLGFEKDWDRSSLILLIIGLCLCAMSYQNAYGFLLTTIILYVIVLINKIRNKDNIKFFIKKGIIAFFITFLLGGSFYIRNYFVYDGDITGTAIQQEMAEHYADSSLKPSNKKSLKDQKTSSSVMLYNLKWFDTAYKSFIGIFGYLNVSLPNALYNFYSAVFGIGLIGFLAYLKKAVKKLKFSEKVIYALFFINIIIAISLNLYYSYTIDFQPQGRYSLALLIPFMYFVSLGIKNVISNLIKPKYQTLFISIFSIIFILLQIYIVTSVFIYLYI